jgi:VWFA-related protein
MRYFGAIALVVVVAAQEAQFGVQSRLVLVPVTVSDAKGRSIDRLEPEDFVLLDNGQPRKVAVDSFATGVAPIALVVAVQSSGISSATLEKVRKIGAMIQPLITGERGCAALMSFDNQVRWRQECTNDPAALSDAFARLTTGGEKSARMLDAVHDAIRMLALRPNARRVLLLISETRDRGSESEIEAVVFAARASGVAIYAATYSAFKTAWTTRSSATADPRPATRPRKPSEETGTPTGTAPSKVIPRLPPPEQRVDILGGIGELMRLSKEKTTEVLVGASGGTTFPFTRQRGLEDAIEKLGAEMHSQYVLSFVPEVGNTPGYHTVEVRVTRPGKVQVRARPGYWASR